MKRIIFYFVIITVYFLVGCSNKPVNPINYQGNKKVVIENTPQNNLDQQTKLDRSISFNCLYEGFVLEKDMFELPRGVVILNTESEWNTFKNKHFSKSTDMDYRLQSIKDFEKQSIMYYSILSNVPSIFSKNFLIDKIQISNNKLSVIPKPLDNTEVTVPNCDSSIYRFVILVAVNKSDILNVEIPSEGGTNDKWQPIDRLRYVQGEIVSLKKISDGKSILALKVEKNYHNGADPSDVEDFPFKIGTVVEFFLNNQPEIDLGKIRRVIVYESDVTTGSEDGFLAASIKYYESNGKFFDMDDKQISLPPTEYPNTL